MVAVETKGKIQTKVLNRAEGVLKTNKRHQKTSPGAKFPGKSLELGGKLKPSDEWSFKEGKRGPEKGGESEKTEKGKRGDPREMDSEETGRRIVAESATWVQSKKRGFVETPPAKREKKRKELLKKKKRKHLPSPGFFFEGVESKRTSGVRERKV